MAFNQSLVDYDNLSPNDPLFWSRPTTVNCHIVRTVGILLCVGTLVGITANGALFVSFMRYKTLRSASNVFVIFMTGIGLVASCTFLPLTGVSSIYCQWMFQRTGCEIDAVFAFLYGCASCYLLCAVSISRCYIIVRPFNANKVTVKRCVVISIAVVAFAFLWTILPLFGWNEYTIEQARISCCLKWQDSRPLYMSYTWSLFVFVYCVPLIILFSTNTITLLGLKNMRQKIERGIQTALSVRRIEMERRILKSVVMTTLGFVVTWTPYAIAFFLAAFRGKEHGTPPAVAFLCACFAKSSVIWIPIIYASTSTQFQLSFVKTNAGEDMEATNRIAPGNTIANKNATMMKMEESVKGGSTRQPNID